ncbi:Uncharacterised protein [Streptococcus acidominimus]|uniref:Uncharacterized protein n=1 Tax=Streptococcus acidominimus TaxID=1326 RepID=A0A380IJ24_STRAI|nr:Uncharacterised protein [Streptococcus acidominimus]
MGVLTSEKLQWRFSAYSLKVATLDTSVARPISNLQRSIPRLFDTSFTRSISHHPQSIPRLWKQLKLNNCVSIFRAFRLNSITQDTRTLSEQSKNRRLTLCSTNTRKSIFFAQLVVRVQLPKIGERLTRVNEVIKDKLND